MNVDTSELIRRLNNTDLGEEFNIVPTDLEDEAIKELAGRNSVIVDMSRKTPLTEWANKVKQGRNEKCSCSSGLKYKNCCGK